MNAINCLVHPQVGTEAFPGVVLEAFACGRPVVASALDGIPEAFAVGDFGQLVKPESVPELASALRDWAGRPQRTMEERMTLYREVARRFSVAAFADRMIGFYRRLIAADP
jgi:glycosyltransferase involved in cell wall biosynthesis